MNETQSWFCDISDKEINIKVNQNISNLKHIYIKKYDTVVKQNEFFSPNFDEVI